MSPKPADPAMRELLVETAARLIATDGIAGLTLRRLTREVGTSTMAIYTHFGSIDELRHAIRREGFARMAARFRAVPRTADPVADLARQGWAYWRNAVENPNLYRAMFMYGPLDDPQPDADAATFDMLIAEVQRCIDAGRFTGPEARPLALQLWSMVHGVSSLHLNGMLTETEAVAALAAGVTALLVAFGDGPDAARRSLGAAVDS